ncbi:hypothetical protein HV157_07785 [Enterobacter sp. RHBSTW-00318]|nr:hypothetical protein [Enterobacter sp. RHBSTW-00318]MBA7775837.1 hypothetical protein [Enterobacter sp. RHBSTW-00318]
MRPLMPPVQTPDNLFHDGNPLTGELGTIVDAEHLNNEQAAIRDTQSELIAILTAAAMEPASTAGQLLAALNKLYAPFNDTLGALSTLVGGANKLPYFTAADAAALTALSSIGRDIIGKATVADVLTYLGLGDGTGRLINAQTFTASGTYTPTAGTKFVIAEVLGGGGGGGSNAATPSAGAAAGAGGASGAYAVCKHTPTGPVSIVIGAGGAGGVSTAAGADGSTGGTSSYGAVSAPGGRGGPRGVAFNTFPTGGNVATGSSGVTGSVIVGTPGTGGSYGILYSDSNATGGGGANSIYGAGGIAITINSGGSGTTQGSDASGYGSGGGGAVSVHTATAASSRGGNGTPGIVIIWEYA